MNLGKLWLSVLSIGVQGLGSAATYLGSLLIMMKVSKWSTVSTGSTVKSKSTEVTKVTESS